MNWVGGSQGCHKKYFMYIIQFFRNLYMLNNNQYSIRLWQNTYKKNIPNTKYIKRRCINKLEFNKKKYSRKYLKYHDVW